MRSCAQPVDVQVLLALRVYASGSFQSVVGDVVHLSQASASRVVNCVSQAIVLMATEEIRFRTARRAVSLTSLAFFGIAGFPMVLGCIDGTHIAIKVSKEDKPAYLNRKGYTSINVQAICNPGSVITELTVKWLRRTHDSYMWRNCDHYDQFAAGTSPDGRLLGDAGYFVQPWLMTPIRTPKGQPEEDYNEALTKTRQGIERTFGILKTRFMCLDKSVGLSEDEEEEEEDGEEVKENNNGPRATRPRRARPMGFVKNLGLTQLQHPDVEPAVDSEYYIIMEEADDALFGAVKRRFPRATPHGILTSPYSGPCAKSHVGLSEDEEEEEEDGEEVKENNNGPRATRPRRARPMGFVKNLGLTQLQHPDVEPAVDSEYYIIMEEADDALFGAVKRRFPRATPHGILTSPYSGPCAKAISEAERKDKPAAAPVEDETSVVSDDAVVGVTTVDFLDMTTPESIRLPLLQSGDVSKRFPQLAQLDRAADSTT
ncbi:putative nuclease HARBI1 [Ixodes scapularis]